jgi:hypothetical protein
VRAHQVGRLIGLPVSSWLRRTVWPSVIMAMLGCLGALITRELLEPGLIRVIAVTAASSAFMAIGFWPLATEAWEREHYSRMLRSARARLTRRFRPKPSGTTEGGLGK